MNGFGFKKLLQRKANASNLGYQEQDNEKDHDAQKCQSNRGDDDSRQSLTDEHSNVIFAECKLAGILFHPFGDQLEVFQRAIFFQIKDPR